ncbi:MAG TPA: cytochrome c-type biogenesis protein [Mesorhizobium sp.]|jgi:cytochrome c-type biogenesis protein CcmH|uniref:cytochrome c-type biogenesis protein n=1 Tax=Mesorhizobium sp. TaxID=1871066 RepID=UPI002DDD8C40|nr:cytochrome c-type biogenesis protein [Mesorhizobium sp.]HEV2503223.1 cytochrome c-type biogenesis protein [Mesorhizobium sp.]
MTMRGFVAGLVLGFVLLASGSAFAVKPDEMLSDPALEARARALSTGLRCMVCQNQSIDESDADLARDLRVLVRDRLKAGDSDTQVIDYVVSRYGEFVLLKPRFEWRNALLWGAPVLLLLVGGGFMLRAARRPKTVETAGLSADEKARLDAMLKRD